MRPESDTKGRMIMADVYFTDFRTHIGTSLPEKLKKLCRAAGIGSIDMEGRFVAIKMHFVLMATKETLTVWE